MFVGEDTGSSRSRRSSGYLQQNKQKEMSLLPLQRKNEYASPSDLTSYRVPTSMVVTERNRWETRPGDGFSAYQAMVFSIQLCMHAGGHDDPHVGRWLV
jgi:hypothetical protein